MEVTARGGAEVEVRCSRGGGGGCSWREAEVGGGGVEVGLREVVGLGGREEKGSGSSPNPIRATTYLCLVQASLSDKMPSKLCYLQKFGNHHLTTKVINLKKIGTQSKSYFNLRYCDLT